jgi:hypothetical protein
MMLPTRHLAQVMNRRTSDGKQEGNVEVEVLNVVISRTVDRSIQVAHR